MFAGVVINKEDDGRQIVAVESIDESQLPEGNVTVDVEYSTINFKDGLAITGTSPVVRSFPMIPGIDFAGVVSESSHPEFKVGDKVVLNGWGVGETRWGGLAEKARLNGDMLIHLPEVFSSRQAMAIGTAGYTAALCVDALVNFGITPTMGEVLVTGATGGVGSFAVSLLAKAGFSVVAATGKASEEEYLKTLGATSIIDRAELSERGKPLQKERWAGVVDSVGSHTLANACAQTKYRGAVAACGLAQGADLPATVMPFILRGVALLGVDSVMAPKAVRLSAWNRLARDIEAQQLDLIAEEVNLAQAVEAAENILRGRIRGRVVVKVKA